MGAAGTTAAEFQIFGLVGVPGTTAAAAATEFQIFGLVFELLPNVLCSYRPLARFSFANEFRNF